MGNCGECVLQFGLVWYFMTRVPKLMVPAQTQSPSWNSTALTILAAEGAAVALILGLTYFLQSRKRDFV